MTVPAPGAGHHAGDAVVTAPGAGDRRVRLGYGTNGFANHRLDDALELIAELGYDGVALTLDHHHLDPFGADLPRRVATVAQRLTSLGLGVVVETGARYLLDPRRKHHPTLVSDGVARRVDFLRRAVMIAADLGADCVSFWSGVLPPDVSSELAWERMTDGVSQLLDEATTRGVVLGLEPEPGHVVERLADAFELRRRLGAPEPLGFTLDVGHCVAVEDASVVECLRSAGQWLVNVQLDDMRRGVHEHLEFGAGELDLPAALAALADVGFEGIAGVELPRHSHAAPEVAARSLAALRAAMPPSDHAPLDHAPLDQPPPQPAEDEGWLSQARARVRTDPTAVRTLFPAVGRQVGRGPRYPGRDPQGMVYGTVDDAARVELLNELGDCLPLEQRDREVGDLYRYGDDAEKRAVLRALAELDGRISPDVGLTLTSDALRTNDVRLVAAAMGQFAATHLDPHAWRHGVLKCLFTGVPLEAVARWRHRADAELHRMVTDFATERRAAGRAVSDDVVRLLAHYDGNEGPEAEDTA